MSGIRGVQKALDVFARGIGIGVEIVVKKVSLQVLTGVVKKTPVDKGHARAGWVIGVEILANSPTFSKNKRFVPADASQAQKFADTKSAAVSFKQLTKLSKIKPYSTVFVSNNLPYIQELENGSSKQARSPNGMVAVTLAEVERDIKRIEREFK